MGIFGRNAPTAEDLAILQAQVAANAEEQIKSIITKHHWSDEVVRDAIEAEDWEQAIERIRQLADSDERSLDTMIAPIVITGVDGIRSI